MSMLEFEMATMVKQDNLLCSEVSYETCVDFNKPTKDDQTVQSVLNVVTAQMNTSGGVVSIAGQKKVSDVTLDKWKRGLFQQIDTIVSPVCCIHCIELRDETDPMTHTQVVHVLTKSCLEFTTLDYALYTRAGVGNYQVRDASIASQIMNQQNDMPAALDIPTRLIYDHQLSTNEGLNVEFKCWKTKNVHEIIKGFQQVRTQRALLAMSNLSSGGHVVIGVGEDETSGQLLIKGQLLTEGDEGILTMAIKDLLMNAETNKMQGDIKNGSSHSSLCLVNYYPVLGCPDQRRRVVIVVNMKHCQAGLFQREPLAYEISIAGKLKRFTFSDWTTRVHENASRKWTLLHECKSCSKARPMAGKNINALSSVNQGTDQSTQVVEGDFSLALQNPIYPQQQKVSMKKLRTLIENHKGSQSTPVAQRMNRPHRENIIDKHKEPKCMKKGRILNEHEEGEQSTRIAQRKDNLRGENVIYSNIDTISWSKHNESWKQRLQIQNRTLEKSISSVTDILKPMSPLRFIPSLDAILYSMPQYDDDIKKCVDSIKAYHGTHHGVVISSKNWIEQISSTKLGIPSGHILDMMCVDTTCMIRIVSMFDDDSFDRKKAFGFVRKVASLTKLQMLTDSQYIPECGQSIYIEVAVWVCGKGLSQSPTFLDGVCQRFLKGQPNQWNVVQNLLGSLLLGRKSSLRRSIGDQCMVSLTMQHMEALLGTDFSQFNLIEGAPGSGKTLLALRVCQQHDPNKCLIACKNPCLKTFLEYQNVCKTFVVRSHSDLLMLLFDSDLQCIILDDGHNLNFEKQIWYRFFQTIRSQKGLQLFIFMDNDFQNFQNTRTDNVKIQFDSYVNEYKVSYMAKKLTEVHRNSQKVVSYISAGFGIPVRCAHDEEGDDVEMTRVSNLNSTESNNGLFLLVQRLMKPVGADISSDIISYDGKDIAVLIDGKDAVSRTEMFKKIFKTHLQHIKVHGADTFPVKGITLDTLDNFSGLDAKVCILVIPDSPLAEARTLQNPRYKAFVASRGIYRVIFLTDSAISSEKVNAMYIDVNTIPRPVPSQIRQTYSAALVDLTYGEHCKQFEPSMVSVCPLSGGIAVTDRSCNAVHILDSSLEQVKVINMKKLPIFRNRPRKIQIARDDPTDSANYVPVGVLVDSHGDLYVCDIIESVIQRFRFSNSMCDTKTVLCKPQCLSSHFRSPCGLAIDIDKHLYVCDRQGLQRISVATGQALYNTEIALPRIDHDDRVIRPRYLAVTEGQIAVVDVDGDVFLLDSKGSHKRTIKRVSTTALGNTLVEPGKIGKAEGVAFDTHGNLVVADSKFGCLHVLSADGVIHDACTIGEGSLSCPQGVAVAADERILVCDTGQNLLLQLRLPKAKQ